MHQLHIPDPEVPIEETVGALSRLVDDGKVRAIGCSNFSPDLIESSVHASNAAGVATFVSVQNQYSLLHREPENGVLEACTRTGMGFLPFFPLHAGLLTGKYTDGEPLLEGSRLAGYPKERLGRFYNQGATSAVGRLEHFCRSRGRSVLELAFSWLLAQRPVVSVIAGATKAEQVQANAAAAGWKLTDEELVEVDALLTEPN